MRLDKFTIGVENYDKAIAFFTEALGFDLVEDSPALTTVDGRPKRWVVVRPPGAETGILLAQADGERQAAAIGNQVAGRVGFFLEVDDFEAAYRRMTAAGVEFDGAPRSEPYGRVAVFLDIAGNRWDLLGPAERAGLLGSADGGRVHHRGQQRHRPGDRATAGGGRRPGVLRIPQPDERSASGRRHPGDPRRGRSGRRREGRPGGHGGGGPAGRPGQQRRHQRSDPARGDGGRGRGADPFCQVADGSAYAGAFAMLRSRNAVDALIRQSSAEDVARLLEEFVAGLG
jgi:predicted enzyme related to lactoylglutathione lyase